jgi:hypothetical protein
LPEAYKAFLGGVPALTVASGNGRPDVSARQWGPRPLDEPGAADPAVLEPDLEARVAIRLDPQPAVHVDFHGQLVAAVELVSPRNKDRGDAKDTYSSLVGLWRRPLRAGQPLPSLPLLLSVHRAVVIDLEETYRRAAQRAYLD